MDRDRATRRKVLTATGAAMATALAGCGSPGEGGEGGDDGEGGAGGDGQEGPEGAGGENGTDEGAPTDTDADDPYAPEGNSTRGSGNQTVSQRTPDDVGEGGDGSSGDEDGGQSGSGAGGGNQSGSGE